MFRVNDFCYLKDILLERFLALKSLCIAVLISTSKNTMSFSLLLISTLQQNWRKAQNRFCLEERGEGERGWGWRQEGEMIQTMYACVNK
jgi:hypothetical protein